MIRKAAMIAGGRREYIAISLNHSTNFRRRVGSNRGVGSVMGKQFSCPHSLLAPSCLLCFSPRITHRATDCNHQGEGRERDCAVAVMWKSTELMYDPI